MDRFGIDVLLPFEDRVNTIVELVRRGYRDTITIAHDAACFNDWFDPEALAQAVPKWNYRHISEQVIPALLERGLTDDDIDAILVRNPRRYFDK
jgi:phosphotriesterase-related protein